MSKKLFELKNQLEQLKAEARQLVEEGKMTEARAKADEAKKLADDIKTLEDLEMLNANNAIPLNTKKEKEEIEEAYKNAFLNAFRGRRLSPEDLEVLEIRNAMTSSADADGGLLVPKDVETKINELKRTLLDLSELVTIENVTTNAGTRVIEKLATMTAFAEITDDSADIAEVNNPQFEAVTYQIKKYAGWLPIPNDLLKDSDQNILDYITRWIAKKSIVTNNSLIMAILTSLTEKTFADWKALKKAVNVDLDPMHAANAKIITNQDGFHLLDTLTDSTGRPLLKDDLTQSSQKVLFGKPVIVVPNSQLATTGTTTKYAPIFVGDFKEGVIKFNRQGYEIATTNIGGTAFRKDRTEMRVIERMQYKPWDNAAMIRGKIDVTAVV